MAMDTFEPLLKRMPSNDLAADYSLSLLVDHKPDSASLKRAQRYRACNKPRARCRPCVTALVDSGFQTRFGEVGGVRKS